ncbi:MAG: DUF2812 domain-containing protein [Roseburia sp.]|nr:DUF2812 domain-containing protein [Roseburia sp.]MCM1099037.1 DUF2812 domain-containing protein [Ruminococcus flavefaciens]
MKEKMTKFKWLVSYQKERAWLEGMAEQGWFLENIRLGVFYTFKKGEPKKVLYDIDKFLLPKKPTLEEIRQKEMFLEMARELGWREVTHSEDMTWYFARDYEEGGVNELHNDPESRKYLAAKCRQALWDEGKKMVFWGAVIAGCNLFVKLLELLSGMALGLGWFDWFTLIYVLCTSVLALQIWRLGVRLEKEMSLSREEWRIQNDPMTHKVVRKLILTNKGLNRFLSSQEKQGWLLTSVTPVRYFFEKSEGGNKVYTMDCKRLTNKRRKAENQEKLADGKDVLGMNNDWELQSVREAEAKGWSFVCALENRAVIYRGEEGQTQPLNDAKYDNSLRWISLIGEYGFYLLCCAALGALAGFLAGFYRF